MSKSKEKQDKEKIESMKSKEEMAREYSSRFSPENGWGAEISKEAFLAGYDARQAEVDELKHYIEHVLIPINRSTVQKLEIDKSSFYKNEYINLMNEIQELKKDTLELIKEITTHECSEWDGMRINATHPEWEPCLCFGRLFKTAIDLRMNILKESKDGK